MKYYFQWEMNTLVLRLLGTLNTRKHNDLETASVSIIRWAGLGWGGETPTLLGPLERDNLNHWTTHATHMWNCDKIRVKIYATNADINQVHEN
jgi:hypothetical protein